MFCSIIAKTYPNNRNYIFLWKLSTCNKNKRYLKYQDHDIVYIDLQLTVLAIIKVIPIFLNELFQTLSLFFSYRKIYLISFLNGYSLVPCRLCVRVISADRCGTMNYI